MQFIEKKESVLEQENNHQHSSLHTFYKKIKALQNSLPNTCAVMGTEWVKLSLTLTKSHPLLPVHFYSLSYLLPIHLHQPLLRRGAPLFPSQSTGFTCSFTFSSQHPLIKPQKQSLTSSKSGLDSVSPLPSKDQAPDCLLPFLTEK